MTSVETAVKLKPVTHYREFPFGAGNDPSMCEAMADKPWENQDKVLSYLRSGLIVAYPMGADLVDWFDRPNRANPLIDGERLGGVTPLTDGVWFWPAGLIHFIEKYNVRLPAEFIEFAARRNWTLQKEEVPRCNYDHSYF